MIPGADISVFDEQGNPVTVSGTWNDGIGTSPVSAFAYGGVYDPNNGDLYFADLFNNMIERYDENGGFIAEWADTNAPTLAGSFSSLNGLVPWGVAYDPANGQIHTTNSNPGTSSFGFNGSARSVSGPFGGLNIPLGMVIVP